MSRDYRCTRCGSAYHSRTVRDACQDSHRGEVAPPVTTSCPGGSGVSAVTGSGISDARGSAVDVPPSDPDCLVVRNGLDAGHVCNNEHLSLADGERCWAAT